MIQYNYLGSGNFKYGGWEILSADEVIVRLCHLVNFDMWDDEYRKFRENYLYLPYDMADRIKAVLKILILILTSRVSGVLFSRIRLERIDILNLEVVFGDDFKIYIQHPDKSGEAVYIDYRDDNNETIYKGNLSLINLDALLNDTK